MCNKSKMCIGICPTPARDIDLEKKAMINFMECISCVLCKTSCPQKARE